jgi:hypothetical protein
MRSSLKRLIGTFLRPMARGNDTRLDGRGERIVLYLPTVRIIFIG